MFALRSVTAADFTPVLSLAEAKAHLRLDSGTSPEDGMINAFRDAACDWVERYTGCALVRRSFEATGTGTFVFPQPNVAVDTPTTAEVDGVTVTTTTATAGFTSAKAEAPALISAVKLLLGDLYGQREASVTGVTVTSAGFSVRALCESYRAIRV